MTTSLAVATPGSVPYREALAWQERLLAERLAGGPDVLLLLEHPPVYTLGRGADERFLGVAAGGSTDVVRVGRGGQVTWHGPGQLVGYPIVDLRGHRQDVHWYVRSLEAVLVAALADVGVSAAARPGYPGVWVQDRKIASIGVGIRRWVTWHGFALNVGCDLDGFAAITPCGIAGVRMTTLAAEGGPSAVVELVPVVRRRFVDRFGYEAWHELASGSASAARRHARDSGKGA